jgi:hypothetical protein
MKMLSVAFMLSATVVLTVQSEVHRLGEYEAQKPWPVDKLPPQQLRIPRQAKSATISGRIRGKASNTLNAQNPNSGATIVARTVRRGVPSETVLTGGRTAEWQTVSKVVTLDLPREVADETFTIELKVQAATGDFYFDDISVEFR